MGVVGGLYVLPIQCRTTRSRFSDTDFDELLQDFVPRTLKLLRENNDLYALLHHLKKVVLVFKRLKDYIIITC
jgi:hypothetical protein